MSGRPYLIDKSALARISRPAVAGAVDSLFDRGLLATCGMIDLEVLYSAKSPTDYERLRTDQAVLQQLTIDQAMFDRALDVQRQLAGTSRHRAASIPDLLIAACAEARGATVLHYDADYDLIAEITGQRTQWVVPLGSVP